MNQRWRNSGETVHNRTALSFIDMITGPFRCRETVLFRYRNPSGLFFCQRQASAHISSMPYSASQPSSSFALVGSE